MSTSAEIVSWPPAVERLRFFSHMLGSRPAALSAPRPLLVEEPDEDEPAPDVRPVSGRECQPGPIISGSFT